eukprot:COSAG02_NODE_1285_length_13457_cov_11.145606_1_plen_148_part_10
MVPRALVVPLLAVACPLGVAAASVVYVSSSCGDDANSGAESSPVRTLPAALRLTRGHSSGGTIALADGETWELQEPLQLDYRDRGLTIEAWHTNDSLASKPLISGGYSISHWRRVSPDGSAASVDALSSADSDLPAVWEAELSPIAHV